MMRDLPNLLRGGYCTRWHSNPDVAHIRETLAEHHARVAQILLALHSSPTIFLIDAALHHDAGEPRVGDLAWPAKRDNPALASQLDEMEAIARDRLGVLLALSDAETEWLQLADRLAAYAHIAQVAPHLLTLREWRQDRDDICSAAERLGVAYAVDRVMRDLHGRID